MTQEELEFLTHNNYIERVYDADSLTQAQKAWEYLLQHKTLTREVILETHRLLMLNQKLDEDEKGHYRTCRVWVGGREGIEHTKIDEAVKFWLLDVLASIQIPGENGKHIQLDHVTYEKIHPFVDGNGRTGRMFMNWQRIQAGLPILIIHEGEEQYKYYEWFK